MVRQRPWEVKVKGRRGAAMVELAIVAPLLIALLFGIIEFGLIIKSHLALSQAAREGARTAALRSSTTLVQTTVQEGAPGFSVEQRSNISVTTSHRVRDDSVWPEEWADGLPDADDEPGETQVKVEAIYPHRTIVGSLFGLGEEVTLSGKMVLHRE